MNKRSLLLAALLFFVSQANDKDNSSFAIYFTKGLEHDVTTGLLSKTGQGNYQKIMDAVDKGDYSYVLQAKQMGALSLLSPMTLLGINKNNIEPLVTLQKPYTIDSEGAAAELVEVYLQAVCRDIHFEDYGTGKGSDAQNVTAIAAQVLDDLGAAYQGPRVSGKVTAAVLFRGIGAGEETGPYISQFLLQPLFLPRSNNSKNPFFASIDPSIYGLQFKQFVTTHNVREFGVTWSDFIAIQNGKIPRPYIAADFLPSQYINNGRVLASSVYNTPFLESFYFPIVVTLCNYNFPLSPYFSYIFTELESEYLTLTIKGKDFDLANTLFAQVSKACAAQKWREFRRLRPEEMAGLLHRAIITRSNPFNLHQSLFIVSAVNHINWLNLVLKHNQFQSQIISFGYKQSELPTFKEASTYLLSQCYPEGCPAHPAYPSGHACFVGAAITIVKALFDDREYLIKHMIPMIVNPINSRELVPLRDGSQFQLTLAGEVNKFASNVSFGRIWAGVHYRSDGQAGLELGEEVALRWLCERARDYNNPKFDGFELTKMNGTRVKITRDFVVSI